MHHPTDKTAHTIAFVTPDVEHWLECEITHAMTFAAPGISDLYTALN